MWIYKRMNDNRRSYSAEFPNGDVGYIIIDHQFDDTPVYASYEDSAGWILHSVDVDTFQQALDVVYREAEAYNAWDPNCWNGEGHDIIAGRTAIVMSNYGGQ